MVAKQAAYIEGFFEKGASMGFNNTVINNVYKDALAMFTPQVTKTASTKEASYLDGFVGKANELGFSKEEALNLYATIK